MTATIRDPGRESPRRRFRLASMEALGFIDRPGVATTWVETVAVRGRHEAPTQAPQPDPFADWQPSDVGSALFRRNIRWSYLVGLLLIAAGAVILGYWIYQRPIAAAEDASRQLTAAAAPIHSHLDDLRYLSSALTDQQQPAGMNATLLAAESSARDLFNASGDVDSSQVAERSAASDVASNTLEATRLLNDAFAFREAIIPALAMPVLEEDPNLVGLDDAARQFGEWRMKFDSVRGVLPAGALPEMVDELELISGSLEAIQSRYLDALRNDDPTATAFALQDLEGLLQTAETLLFDELTQVQVRVNERLELATAQLRSLLS